MLNGACQGEVRTGLRTGAHGLVVEDVDEALRGLEGYLRTSICMSEQYSRLFVRQRFLNCVWLFLFALI